MQAAIRNGVEPGIAATSFATGSVDQAAAEGGCTAPAPMIGERCGEE
jgi:hypothetical protein